MKIRHYKFLPERLLTLTLSFGLVVMSSVTKADDTEIFTGVVTGSGNTTIEQNPDFFANVLFVLDNSTSMGSTEPVLDRIIDLAQEDDGGSGQDCTVDLNDYDRDTDYSFGNDTNDSDIYIYTRNGFSNKIVSAQQNQCKSYNDRVVNGNEPYIRSQIIQWGKNPNNNNRYRWDNSVSRMDSLNSSGTECRADLGVHGHFTRNTGDTRPRNWNRVRNNSDIGQHYFRGQPGSNPYNGAENVFWVSGNYHRWLRLRAGLDDLPANCSAAGSGGVKNPFDSSQPLGTVNNPNEANAISDMCGDPNREDRDARTGRSVLDGVFYKNRYYKLEDPDNEDLIRVYRCQTRLETMKEALSRVLTDETRINAGLMRFNANNGATPGGGTIVSAIAPMNDADNKKKILDEIAKLEFGNATPLAESLYEGYLYFSGKKIDQGRQTPGRWNENHATFDVDFLNFDTRVRSSFETDPRAKSGGNYVSPIKTQCQPNSIVLLSDGEPTGDTGRNNAIGNLTGAACNSCSDDIAGYMKNTDVAPSRLINNGVNTFTIGLNLDSNTLKRIAEQGAPDGVDGYFTANDTNGLELAFRSILGQIESTDADVFSAPAVTVNAFNRLQNREDIYYALFKPEKSARWGGNVKKYKVDGGRSTIVDSNNADAIDTAEGFFKETAKSFWSGDVDGNVVNEGGAGEQIRFARRLFGNVDGNDIALSSPTLVDAANTFVTATQSVDIGASTASGDDIDTNKLKIAAWTLGLDIDGERDGSGFNRPNQYVGDSLHGTPYVLSFGDDINNPQDVIFYTSNQGLLHAIDGDSGDELWSYVVDNSLYPNLGTYYNNELADKLYGLDGEIAFRVRRDPATTQEIDEAFLYFGQRRGGNKVFSVDVTEARRGGVTAPMKRRWVIEGGTGGTPGFSRMGQTWAEPVVADASYCADDNGCPEDSLRSVVFISGGYDDYYDDQGVTVAGAPDANVLGNAIYMVDAETGALLWMVGSEVVDQSRDLVIPEMKHSIVSKPTLLDLDANGAVDTMFAIDVSGQVFRIDFKTSRFDTDDISSGDNTQAKTVDLEDGSQTTIDNVSGGIIADLSETGVNRRFYSTLDIALLPQEQDDVGDQVAPARYVITTGSGYRAHPLDAESFGNRFYALYDANILNPKADDSDETKPVYEYVETANGAEIIRPDELESIDISVSGEFQIGGSLEQQIRRVDYSQDIPLDGGGYYINMPLGAEKLLNSALISDFIALTTSYVPADNNASNLSDQCEAGLGRSIVYGFDLLRGRGIELTLNNPGISPSPVVVYVADKDNPGGPAVPVVIIGTEPIKGEEVGFDVPDLGRASKNGWWESGRIQ